MNKDEKYMMECIELARTAKDKLLLILLSGLLCLIKMVK